MSKKDEEGDKLWLPAFGDVLYQRRRFYNRELGCRFEFKIFVKSHVIRSGGK
jgi:hypothetical protein